MALSGSIAYSLNAGQLVNRAFQVVNINGENVSASGGQWIAGMSQLNMMLKTWQMEGPNLWSRAETSVSLVSGTQTYTLSPRPRDVMNVRFAIDGVEQRPLAEWARQDWDRFPNKSATGAPTLFVVDRQRTSTTLTFWPKPSFSSGTWTCPYSYERVLEDITATTDDVDIPQEAFELATLALGARLADEYQVETPSSQRVRARAAELYSQFMQWDRRGGVRITLER